MCEICEQAWAEFDRWLSAQCDEVQDLDVGLQADLYASTEGSGYPTTPEDVAAYLAGLEPV